MSQPTGECPVCKKNIGPADDAVVCPECGAPYHRECYQSAGSCMFEHKHGTGFEYAPPKPKQAEPAPNAAPGGMPTVKCPACGTDNAANGIFCQRCGTPLHANAPGGPTQQGGAPFGGPAWQQPGQGQNMPGQNTPGGMGWQPMFNMPDPSQRLDDIPLRDWNTYVGASSQSYIPRFLRQEQRGSKTDFLFSAFFFPDIYFAYRKMWGLAAAAFLAISIYLVPSFALSYMEVNGLARLFGLSLTNWELILNVCYFLFLGFRLLSGIFATWLYRRQGAKKMKAAREEAPDEMQYQQKIQRKGGTSIPGVVVVFLLYMLICGVVSVFVGTDMLMLMVQAMYI